MGVKIAGRARRSHFIWAATASALIVAGTIVSQAAMAQSEPAGQIEFNIPAQDLNKALLAFTDRAGLQIFYDLDKVAGKRSSAVQGRYAPMEALSRLLGGTGLTFRATGNRLTLESAPPSADGAIQLGPVRVEGTREGQGRFHAAPSQAEIGNRPPAYSGGQVAGGAKVGLLGNRDIFDTPFNVTSYTAEIIENQQAQSIGDVLANDPSVRNSYPRGGEIDEFTIRGFTLYNREISYGGLFGILPSEVIAAELADRVEIIKGPNALLSGISPANSVGGGINITPKRAGVEPLTRFTASYASDSQFGGHVDIGRRFGNEAEFGVRFNGVYRGGDFALDHSSQKLALAAIGLDYQGARGRISFDAGYQDRNLDAPQMLLLNFLVSPVPKAPDNRTNFFQPWTYRDTRDAFGVLRGEVDLTDSLTAFGAVGAKDSQSKSVQTNWSLRDGDGTIRVAPYQAKDYRKAVTGEAGLRARFTTGGVSHALTISGSVLDQHAGDISTTTDFIFSNIYKPVAVAKPAFAALARTPRTSEIFLSSIAIADTLSIANDKVQLTLGVRQQGVETKNFNATTGAIASSYDESATTPMFALLVKPHEKVSLYANYIEGLSQGPTAPSNAVNAGEVFPPYKSKQYEVGAKFDLSGFGITLSAFQISRPNSFSRPISDSDPRLIFGLDGQQRNRGIELNLFGTPVPGVRLLGGAAYTDAKLRRTRLGVNQGNQAGGVPEWQVNLGAEWDIVSDFTVMGRLIHTGEQYMDAANTMLVPDWTRIDIGARYNLERLGIPATLRLNIENLLDKNYWASGSRETLYLGAPRTILVSASIDF